MDGAIKMFELTEVERRLHFLANHSRVLFEAGWTHDKKKSISQVFELEPRLGERVWPFSVGGRFQPSLGFYGSL